LASATYYIDPDGAGASDPFAVYCEMTEHHGGWALVAKLSASAPDGVKVPFTEDRNTSDLTNGLGPVADTLANFNLARFDAYGHDYTIRIATDVTNAGQQFQYTFYRPATGQTLLPSVAGSDWIGKDTAARTEYLVMATATGQANTTWLPTPGWDVACGVDRMIFGSRIFALAGGGDCMSGDGQTQTCHAPAGALLSGCSMTGTWTAAHGHGDGVPHSHGHDATYWIKDANITATP
jgi:hypothetical protein